MKNILQNIFLFFAVFLFNWGYGQVCTQENIQKIVTNANYPGINATLNSLTPSGSGNTAATSGIINNLIDNDLTSPYSLQSSLPTRLTDGSLNANFSINNLDIKKGEVVSLKLSENERYGGSFGTTQANITYTIIALKGNTSYNITPTNTLTSVLDSREGLLYFTSPEDIDRINVQVNATKEFNGLSTQRRLEIDFYGLYVNPLCEEQVITNCNQEVNLINSTFNNQLTALGSVTNSNNVLNDNLNDAATFLISGNLTITNKKIFSGGQYVAFELQESSLADLGYTYTIETLVNNIVIESKTFTNGGITLAASGKRSLGFSTTQPFNQVRISGTVVGISTVSIYRAFIIDNCPNDYNVQCNIDTPVIQNNFAAILNTERSGNSALLTAGNLYDNPNYVVDNNPNNYATIFAAAGAAATSSIAVKSLGQTFPGGYFAGFLVENSSLVNLDLLSNIRIKTYRNDVLIETAEGNALGVSLQLLPGTNKRVIGFVTSTGSNYDFDEIVFETFSTASVSLGVTNIYQAIVRKLCEGPDLSCNQRTILDDTIYPISISGNTGVEGLLSLGSVTEPRNAIDNDPTTYASMNILAGALSKATLAIKKSLSPYPANTYVSFEVENSSLLNISVLSNYGIRLLRNGVQVGIAEGNNLLVGANLLGSSRKTIGFKAPAEFDEIQFIINNAGLSADLGVTKVHNVKVMQPCAVPIVCDEEYVLNDTEFPVVINALRTGPTSAACVGCSVKNPENILSSDNTDFATLNIPVGLLSGVSVSVEDLATVYPAGTKVGFTINDVPGILQLDLLESLQITTYLNGVPQETASAAELIDLSLIFNLVGSGTKNYGFQTTKSFDEVQLTVFSVLNAFNEMKVYNLRFDTKNSNGEGLICIGNPFAEDDTFTLNPGQTSSTSIIDNDTSNNAPAVIGQNVDLTLISPSIVGINLNSNGQIVVDPNVLPGIYQLEYRICNIDSPTSCDTAIIQVIVKGINDIDGDGIADEIDLDNDNDGILDTEENLYCDQTNSPYGNDIWPISTLPNDNNLFQPTRQKQLLMWNWSEFDEITNGVSKSLTLNGTTYTATISDISLSTNNETKIIPSDVNTYSAGGNQMFHHYYNVLDNNYKEAFYLDEATVPSGADNDIKFKVTIQANYNNKSIPIEVFASDAETTNTLDQGETINITTNGSNFKILEQLGNISGNISSTVSGIDTNSVQFRDTQTSNQNALVSTFGQKIELTFTLGSRNGSLQGVIFGVVLRCDTDNDGLPNYLDSDSDNDGCLDAIEGGDKVKPEQVKPNGQINSTVDSNGVPTLINPSGLADFDGLQGQSNNDNKPYNVADTTECTNLICVKPGNTERPGVPTITGISTLQNTRNTWPNDIPNGFIALDSKNKGMVITRVPDSDAIENPVEGMLIYDVFANCVKLYNGTTWKCLEQTCNE